VKTGQFLFVKKKVTVTNFVLVRAHRIGQIRDVHIYRFISQVGKTDIFSMVITYMHESIP
jgi:hypothetical protein